VMPLHEQIAAQAQSSVDTVTQTHYQHPEYIDAAAGIYDCDCNGFVGFVLETVAPVHYQMIPKEPNQPRPRAFKYYDFFVSLTPDSPGGWHRIDLLRDALPGDIIAWRFLTIEVDENTGHVMIVAATATVDHAGVYSVRVCDSAAEAHFPFDTRDPGNGVSPNGVGSGFLRFKVDAAGRPIAFQFAPPDTVEFTFLPIAMGRAEPL